MLFRSSIAVENAEYNVEALMNFSEVNEEVTAKDKTNLRNRPSQEENSTIVTTLKNGEIAIRTGISASGWSRITFNDTTYYAVSNFLTNDISYKTPSSTIVPTEDTLDGIKTKFTAISDTVSPKMEVNLRSLPSVTNPDSNIIATLKNGEKVSRTGINTELGWSRIDYNGQTL